MKKIAKSVPVLAYHHVTPKGGSLSCSVKNFESQMQALVKNRFTTLSAEQFAGFMKGEPVPEKSVLLTFDDGYLNNFVYAYPTLKKYHLHATMFLVTSLLHEGPVRPTMGSTEALPNCPDHHVCKQKIRDGFADEVIVRWAEVHEMQASGTYDFHSHTNTHVRWDLQDDGRDKNRAIREDLRQSRAVLQQRLGSVSDKLCWPQGYFDDEYIQIAQDVGFQFLYTTQAYGFNIPFGPAHHIYRVTVRDRGGSWLMYRLWWARHLFWGKLYNGYKLKTQENHEAKRLRKVT